MLKSPIISSHWTFCKLCKTLYGASMYSAVSSSCCSRSSCCSCCCLLSSAVTGRSASTVIIVIVDAVVVVVVLVVVVVVVVVDNTVLSQHCRKGCYFAISNLRQGCLISYLRQSQVINGVMLFELVDFFLLDYSKKL